MIYCTSDLHFWHKNAIVYTNRPFVTAEEMNEKLIENWNKTVHQNDEVYILGDVTMVRVGRAMEILSQLKGRKYLLMGNHDYFAREKTFYPRASGIEWVKMYHELHWQNRTFVLCHYPFLSWNKDSHGSFNLHGHLHSTTEYNLQNRENGRHQFDVGVDANDFKPVSLERIVSFFEEEECHGNYAENEIVS